MATRRRRSPPGGWAAIRRASRAAAEPESDFGSILVPIFGKPLDDDIVQTAGRLAGESRDDLEEEGAVQTALEQTLMLLHSLGAQYPVLEHAIAFTPTVVTLENVRVIGNQIYLLLLIADRDGEKSIEALSAPEPSQEEPTDLSGGVTRVLTYCPKDAQDY